MGKMELGSCKCYLLGFSINVPILVVSQLVLTCDGRFVAVG